MKTEDLQQLLSEVKVALSLTTRSTFAILGHTPTAYDVQAFFKNIGAEGRLLGVYADITQSGAKAEPLRPLKQLSEEKPDFIIVASDVEKEKLLEPALPHLNPAMRVLLGGYGHFSFQDPLYEAILANGLVPSLANGYPHTLIHLYQCLKNSSRLNIEGVVAEFGMFKGGTTMLLARFVKAFRKSWPVIGFDTFSGFPARRSVLDMYNHPGCVFSDEDAVRAHVKSANIEVVSGDIVETASRLVTERIVLAFIDTDNYTSATAVLDVIQDRVVPGGAIVFDHFTGRNRFLYTLGERIAAKRLLEDTRYFNLHDTGVFFKQQ
jgi:O-methyltransferase